MRNLGCHSIDALPAANNIDQNVKRVDPCLHQRNGILRQRGAIGPKLRGVRRRREGNVVTMLATPLGQVDRGRVGIKG